MDHRLGQGIRVAEKILREWLGVKKGQKLLFMANPQSDQGVINAFSAAAGELGAEAFVFIKKPHADNLEEFPKPLAEAIKYVDICLVLSTREHCVHTLTHLTATIEYGTRFCNLFGLTMDSLLSPEITDADAGQLRRRNEYLGKQLLGQRVRITTESGSDLSLEFDTDVDNPVFYDTFERGGLATIPGGAAHFHPRDGSVNGVLVCDTIHWHGDTGREKVRFTFKNDWCAEVSGGPGDLAEQLWDEMKRVKYADYLGEVGFGLNPFLEPGIKRTGLINLTRMGGSMHIGMGESIWYGGRISCPILRVHCIFSPRIEVNGKIIVEKNQFMFERGGSHG